MRGTRIKLTIGAVLAAALLGACTSNGSTATSTPSLIGAGLASANTASAAASTTPASTAAAPTTAAPITVPPVTVPPASTPATSSSVGSTTKVTNSPPVSTPATLTPTSTSKPPVVPATFTISPQPGNTTLSPRTPIVIKAAHGTLDGVELVKADGAPVKGALNAARTTWTLTEPLGYDASYELRGRAVAANGKPTPISGSYQTVSPDGLISASISPSDGRTVGIGAPILISLGTDIDDTTGRQNIEKAITVTTVPKTEGGFAWIRHDDGWGLDWRPKNYWAPGTKVTVAANLYGVSYGNGLYGEEDLTSSFTIGRSEITKADIKTHRLKVYRDGKLAFDFPTSFGLESDPGRVTRGGTYIVMSKEYLHLMNNPAYHYTNFKAYYAVRISNNGTFIHANQDTADVQGKENVTHGCANLTLANAKLFYDQTLYGDPVEVTNSSIPVSASDGDIRDWSIPWAEWQSLSALSKSYAG